MRKRFYYITKPILVLSIVSLFTDMGSEMLYPVMPVYLESIGFSILLIGILEGVVECVAGLSKGYFGQLSDKMNKRLPFVQLGYLLSAIAKPMLACFTYPVWVFFSRTVDRFGKGLRSAPRDAMLSLESNKEDKAKVFGFHRSMDTVGAVLGPLIALAFLHFYPASYKTLFMLAFIPGVIAVIATLALREKKAPASVQNNIHFFSFISYFPKASTEYKKLVSGLLLFALINSSDVLLLLKMKESNIHDTAIIGAYIFYNLIFALLAFPAGIAADKLGFRRTFITGLLFFAIVYAGFSQVETLAEYAILFLLYGIYASCTEGVAKAWITHITPPEQTATAIGAYTALQSTAALIASSLAGFIWYQYGAAYAFSLTAVFAVILIFYFLQLKGGTKN